MGCKIALKSMILFARWFYALLHQEHRLYPV
jgi:hypothetical protein